jgi:hypothetical protein
MLYVSLIVLFVGVVNGYRIITSNSVDESPFEGNSLLDQDLESCPFYVELQFHTKGQWMRDADNTQNQNFASKMCGFDPHQTFHVEPSLQTPIVFDETPNYNKPVIGLRACCSSQKELGLDTFAYDDIIVYDSSHVGWRYSGCVIPTDDPVTLASSTWDYFRDDLAEVGMMTAVSGHANHSSVCQMGLSWTTFTFDEDVNRPLGPTASTGLRVYSGLEHYPVYYSYQVDDVAGDCQLLCGSYAETSGCTKKCGTDPAVCATATAHECTCDSVVHASLVLLEPGYCGFEFEATSQDWIDSCGPFTQSAFRLCSSQGTIFIFLNHCLFFHCYLYKILGLECAVQCECANNVNNQTYDIISHNEIQCNAYKRNCTSGERSSTGCGAYDVAECTLYEHYLSGSLVSMDTTLASCLCTNGRNVLDGGGACGFESTTTQDACTLTEIATHCSSPELTTECLMTVFENTTRSHLSCSCRNGPLSNPAFTSPETDIQVTGETSESLQCVYSERPCTDDERVLCGDMSLNVQEELIYGRWGCYVSYDSTNDAMSRMCRYVCLFFFVFFIPLVLTCVFFNNYQDAAQKVNPHGNV